MLVDMADQQSCVHNEQKQTKKFNKTITYMRK
jgi:hypothetical protein